jgi:hypothetical protein
MAKQFNADEYVKFALITPIEGSWGFTSYTDLKGDTYRAISGYFPSGLPRNFEIYWSAVERIHRFPKNKTLRVLVNGREEQMKQMDYIKNHPACEDSPNKTEYQPTLFKALDPIKDAGLVLDRIKRRNQAVNEAFALDGRDLDDMAILLGVFNDDLIFKQARIAEFAGQDPEAFLKYLSAGDRPVRAVIRKAISVGKLKQTGEAIFWEKESLGGNEDHAVSYLTSNPEKLQALEELIGFVPQKPLSTKKAK